MPQKLSRPVLDENPCWRPAAASEAAEIESWAKQQKDKPSRSEAIRQLLEVALASKAKIKQRSQIEVNHDNRTAVRLLRLAGMSDIYYNYVIQRQGAPL